MPTKSHTSDRPFGVPETVGERPVEVYCVIIIIVVIKLVKINRKEKNREGTSTMFFSNRLLFLLFMVFSKFILFDVQKSFIRLTNLSPYFSYFANIVQDTSDCSIRDSLS